MNHSSNFNLITSEHITKFLGQAKPITLKISCSTSKICKFFFPFFKHHSKSWKRNVFAKYKNWNKNFTENWFFRKHFFFIIPAVCIFFFLIFFTTIFQEVKKIQIYAKERFYKCWEIMTFLWEIWMWRWKWSVFPDWAESSQFGSRGCS